MAFTPINAATYVKFNSANSSKLIQTYRDYKTTKIQEEGAKPKSRTFAPSSIRCCRKSWFRLRGSEPDFLELPDLGMEFRAEVGTARHYEIQKALSESLKEDWIDVASYLDSIIVPYKYTISKSGYETRIEIEEPAIKFACDGVVRLNGKLFLLEIKTSDYDSFASLSTIKTVHKDQVIAYSSLLKLPDVLVLYEDRLNGDMKCYELHITHSESETFYHNIEYVMNCVRMNLAPDRLPAGDYACKNCEYRKKCKAWG